MNKRQRYFIDRAVQGRLLGLLVLFEVLLFVVAMVVVYLELQAATTTAVAAGPASAATPVLIAVLIDVLPWVLVANLVMVFIVANIWGRYVKSIVTPLKQLLSAVEKLDLRGNGRIDNRHEALDIGRRWILQERERNIEIRECIRSLGEDIDIHDDRFREKMRRLLAEIKVLLPKSR